jgi:hypothetical protein
MTSEVDQWFSGKAAEPTLRRVREVILSADPQMTEYLKYGTVQFAYAGDFANFVQHNEKKVSLMFNAARESRAASRIWKGMGRARASCGSLTWRTSTSAPAS